MFCERCGKAMPEETTFCPSCGARVGDPHTPGVATPGVRPPSAELAERAKATSQDTVQALRLFAANPTGGLLPAFENLDRQRALAVSIAFALLFDACLLIGMYRVLGSVREQSGSYGILGELGVGEMLPENLGFFKLFIFGLVPFVSFSVALMLVRVVFRGTGSIEGDTFTAGAALLPFGFFVLLSGFLGIANIEVSAVLSLFAVCYMILILFTGCTRIAKISDAGAALAVPLILLASAYLAKIIVSVLWSSGMAS